MSARTPSVAANTSAPKETRQQQRLAERRRRIRRIEQSVLGVILLGALVGLVWLLWRPGIRIADIEVQGAYGEEIKHLAHDTLGGSIAFLFPRDSIFLLPEDNIRTRVLATYPDIASVTISRTGFSSIEIGVVPRVPAIRWCGEEYPASATCYVADADGLIFASAASTTDGFSLYAPLTEATSSPIRAYIKKAAEILPGVTEFAAALAEHNLTAESIVLSEDEARVYLAGSGTYITYVLGKERETIALLSLTMSNLPVPIDSLEYVDLRFPGKAYFKKKE